MFAASSPSGIAAVSADVMLSMIPLRLESVTMPPTCLSVQGFVLVEEARPEQRARRLEAALLHRLERRVHGAELFFEFGKGVEVEFQAARPVQFNGDRDLPDVPECHMSITAIPVRFRLALDSSPGTLSNHMAAPVKSTSPLSASRFHSPS